MWADLNKCRTSHRELHWSLRLCKFQMSQWLSWGAKEVVEYFNWRSLTDWIVSLYKSVNILIDNFMRWTPAFLWREVFTIQGELVLNSVSHLPCTMRTEMTIHIQPSTHCISSLAKSRYENTLQIRRQIRRRRWWIIIWNSLWKMIFNQ